MFGKHVDREGNTILVAQMTDDHLTNFIRMVCRRIIERKKMADSADMVDEYSRKLYGLEKMDVEAAALHNRMDFDALMPYIVEAFIRDLKPARDILVRAVGRSTSLQDAHPFLPEHASDIEDAFKELVEKEVKEVKRILDPADPDVPF